MLKQETRTIPTCSRSDGGETVDYTVELIVLDYTIAPTTDIGDV